MFPKLKFPSDVNTEDINTEKRCVLYFFILQFGAHAKRICQKSDFILQVRGDLYFLASNTRKDSIRRSFTKKRKRWDDFFPAKDCKMHCPRDYFLNRCDSQLPQLENKHGGVYCFQSN